MTATPPSELPSGIGRFPGGRSADETAPAGQNIAGGRAGDAPREESTEALVMAALWERRKFTAGEILSRLAAFGVKMGRAELDLVLADIAGRFREDPAVPFVLVEAGGRYWLKGKSARIEMIASNGKIKPAGQLGQRALEVLAIVIFRPGITRSEMHEILRYDPAPHLEQLQAQQLAYSVPGPRRSQKWRATPEVLLRFGYQNWRELPHFEEFRNQLQSLPGGDTPETDRTLRV